MYIYNNNNKHLFKVFLLNRKINKINITINQDLFPPKGFRN